MGGHTEEFSQRLQACTEGATVRGVMFNWVVAEIATQFGAAVSKQLVRQLKPSGWGTLLAYPASEFVRLLFAIAEANLPQGLEPDETWRVLGTGCSNTFLGSTLGRSLLALFRQVGPEAFLPQLPPAYRLFASYGSRSVERLGPGEGLIRFRGEVVPAAFHLGLFETGIRAAHLMATLEITTLTHLDFDLHARWE